MPTGSPMRIPVSCDPYTSERTVQRGECLARLLVEPSGLVTDNVTMIEAGDVQALAAAVNHLRRELSSRLALSAHAERLVRLAQEKWALWMSGVLDKSDLYPFMEDAVLAVALPNTPLEDDTEPDDAV